MDLNFSLVVPTDTIALSSKVQRLEEAPKGLGRVPDPQEGKENLKDAAMEFEAFFLYYMLKTMRETIPKGGFLGSGNAEKVYTSLLDESLAKNMALRGGLGLSKIIEEIS
jgi:Rod binding domain-containing protein